MDVIKLLDLSIGIAALAVIVVIVRIFMKFISNHVEDSTKASQRLADSIGSLSDWLKERG